MQLEVCRQRVQLGASRGFQGFLQDQGKEFAAWWRLLVALGVVSKLLRGSLEPSLVQS